ncbi:TonB-dependent receptor [Rhodonellum sp.]|uniref:TonB-dependent receptor n=1 Tax=Rhodonellum sp. TaxID=2231180 RepID=UPI00271A93CB|nr:TonB-dependent receptor [Rhodonellum sp.]MDO9551794.1 TonB-dependent receptor [Rhodonellum sp.]
MKKSLLFLLVCIGLSFSQTLQAQTRTVTGKVITEEDGLGLPGAAVLIKGTTTGTTTDMEGKFSIDVPAGRNILVISFIGLRSQEVNIANQSSINVTMLADDTDLSEIIVTGTRVGARSRIDSPVPVDIIPVSKVIDALGQVDLNQILTYIAPSFQSSRQTISDGSDHVDPAQLRGLGTDQVLVLVNGKRRHQSALVNVNGTVNRGSVGTDLNAIPANSVEKIEILRDGAAAQYGSDAIAGVVNIILKKSVGLSGSFASGTHVTNYDKNFIVSGGENSSVSVTDGTMVSAGLNYGMKVGKEGFLNVTGEYVKRGFTNRTGTYAGQIFPAVGGVNVDNAELLARGLSRDDFDMRIGNSEVNGGGIMINFSLPLKNGMEIYSFGGYNNKKGNAAGFYRYPNSVPAAVRGNVFQVYPNGFLPKINTDITDLSNTIGLMGTLGEWRFDLSNTFGQNIFDFEITESVNYTQALQTANFQTEFDAGGLNFLQNTINFDAARKYDVLAGLNVAVGAEFRFEQFGVRAGEETSYRNFNPDAGVPAGSQVFGGFTPSTAGYFNRNNKAVYLDVEQEFTKSWNVAAAIRFEDYSDFGSTFNYKLASRYKIAEGFALRASTSTGFRAPSMQQIYYSRVNTLFVTVPGSGLIPIESGTFRNNSEPARILGIPTLKQETSRSYTIGTTLQPTENLEITVDAYQIDIDDRIVLTNNFNDGGNEIIRQQLAAANATTANFFTNAIDTRARGIESVITYNVNLNSTSSISFILAGTFINNTVKKDSDGKAIIKGSPILEQTGQLGNYFNREDQSRIEVANPRDKVSFMANYNVGKFTFMARAVRFGQVVFLDPTMGNDPGTWPVNTLTGNRETLDQTFSPKVVTDVTLSYKFTDHLRLNVGANNLFDVYQDMHNHSGNFSAGRFVYSRRVQQMGFNGRFIFARMSFNF